MNRKNILSLIVAIAAIGAAVVTSAVIKRNNGTILNRNVEALMEQEHAIGYCDDSYSNECTGVCEDCGELVYASNHHGRGYDIHHI